MPKGKGHRNRSQWAEPPISSAGPSAEADDDEEAPYSQKAQIPFRW